MNKNTAAWAREIARDLLETPLPRRWAHTQGVARQARTLAPILGDNADLLEAAAWLHDIGYSPTIAHTGFHPLDGARHLRDTHQADETLCRLVANHSCALIEAAQRGLDFSLTTEFPQVKSDLREALTYCDMTTSPDGRTISSGDRVTEVCHRYGPDHLVTKFIRLAEPHLLSSVRYVECMRDAAQPASNLPS